MELNLETLKSQGGLLINPPVKDTIKYTIDGEEYECDVYVRKIPFADFERAVKDTDHSHSISVIVNGIRLGENATESLDYEAAQLLHPSVAKAMIDVVNKHNIAKKKPSQTTSDSGAT